MLAENLLIKLLGTQGWTVASWDIDEATRTVTIRVEPGRRWGFCSGCGAASKHLRGTVKRRRWKHLRLGRYASVVESPLRRVDCRRCGLRVEAVPWARPGSRFSRELEDGMLAMAREASFLAVAHHFEVGWKVVAAMVARLIRWYSERPRRRALRVIGVDEVSYGKGQQKYLTVVWDHEAGEVVWVGQGRDQATLERFYAQLGRRRCAKLRVVTMDMYQGYIQATRAAAGQATIVFDRFHIERHLTRAIDEIRKQEFFRRGEHGRRLLRGKRWLLMRKHRRVHWRRRTPLYDLLILNHRLCRAYVAKEAFEHFWTYRSREGALAFLHRWRELLKWQRLEPLQRFTRMIFTHLDGVLAWATERMTNAALEGNNARIRSLSHRGHGFRNVANLIERVYHCFTPASMPWIPHARRE
ncbi:MAG: ISL3 family transposase [Nitrospirota bacterium]